MIRIVTVTLLVVVAACTVYARTNPTLTAEVIDTEQTIFSSGGTIEIAGSFGALEIVGWERPEIELVVTKTARHKYTPEDLDRAVDALDRITVNAETRGGNRLVIRTVFPSRSVLRPIKGKSNVHLTYTIRVPRQTSLIVNHEGGEVNVQDVAGSMQLSNRLGQIEVSLPEDERYSIDAKAKIGAVNSDWFPSISACDDGSLAPHQLHLRVGIGEITVRNSRQLRRASSSVMSSCSSGDPVHCSTASITDAII